MQISFVFLLLALIAEIIGTIGGFGSSVFFVPVANFYFDFHSVLGLTAIFHLASNISKIVLFKKGLDKRLLLWIGAPSVVFVILGGFLTKYFNSGWLEIALGIFLVSMSLLFLIRKKLVIKAGNKEALIGGSISGFTAGLLGTGGAVRGLTMAAFNLEKSVFIATSAFIDFAVDLSRTVVYVQQGFVHRHDLIYVPFLFAIGLIGTFLGKRILNSIPQDRFKRISLFLILVIGLVTMVKVLWWNEPIS